MINLFNKFNLILITLLFSSFNVLTAQKWVDVMLDSNSTLSEKSSAFESYWSDKDYEKGKGFKQFKRIEYNMKGHDNVEEYYKSGHNVIEDYKKLQSEMAQEKSMGAAGRWTQLGPFGPATGSGSGRINCIAFHPTNSNIIIVGAPSGGIWRSTDKGNNWSTNTDDFSSIGFSDIAFAPSNGNIVYAASGDRDGDDTYSFGILKSTDGGINWSLTDWTQNYYHKRQTYRLLVHPTNADIVYASTSLGLYKTIDGGLSWEKKRVGIYKDMEFKPNDPNTIYIASTSSVLKTVDGADNFTLLSTLSFSSATRRLEIAVTAAAPDYLYVLAGRSSDNGFEGLYLSTDGGDTFTTKANSPNLLGWNSSGSDSGGQAWYDLALAVSPTNKNFVFVGGVNIWRSVNTGSSWAINGHWTGNNAPYVHADIHMIKYSPHNANTVWACTDGGLSVSTNNGGQWTEKNNQLSIGQMYRLGASRTNSDLVMTGWQDNGSNLMTTTWDKVLGGDGMECIVSHSSTNVMYGSLYYGSIKRSLNGGNSWSTISDDISEEGAWVTPYVMHATNSSLLYAGYSNIWKTTNGGSSWSKISNFGLSSTFDAIATAKSNSQIIWAASGTNIYKTTNGGNTWNNVGGNTGNGDITYIAINDIDPNIAWVSKSGFFNGYKVYETRDAGNTWENISGSLPNYPANCIINDPNSDLGLYVALDLGVYYRDTVLKDWVPFFKGLPNVVVRELELFAQGNKIRAATYGRGLWESDIYALANSNQSDLKEDKLNVKIYPNPAKDVIYINFVDKRNNLANIYIYNSIGNIVYENSILNKENTPINTSKFAAGIYFIKIISDSQVFEYKLIIN